MKNLFGILAAMLILTGCARVDNKKKPTSSPASESDSTIATAKLTPEEINRYHNLVQSHLQATFGKSRFNGQVLVAKHGQIVYENYVGFADVRRKTDSITAHTSQHLASVSKTFCGMAVLRLVEQGKINLDDTVGTYLPGFPCPGVTVRLLLNHRSGIPKYDHYMEEMGWDKKRLVTNQDVLDFLIARHKEIPIGTPNRGFSYSNTNFALLALIVEKTSGLSYPEYMKKTFFEPLSMNDTYVFTMADSARYCPSFHYNNRPYAFEFLDLVYGDKNIYSTARDLLKWDQALKHNGFYKKETLDQAYAGYSFEKPGTHNYGLGWRMYILKNGKKLIYHNGWWHGNRTAFYRMLDEDAVIICLANNDCRTVYKVKQMADIFGDYMQGGNRYDEDDPSASAATTAEAAPAPAPVKKAPAKKKVVHKKKSSRRR